PRRVVGRGEAGARLQWADRHPGDDSGCDRRRRRLGSRISGAVALAAPALALAGRRKISTTGKRSAALHFASHPSEERSYLFGRPSLPCPPIRRLFGKSQGG